MLLILGNCARFVTSFSSRGVSRLAPASSSTSRQPGRRLSASLLDELQRSLSGALSTMTNSGSKYYTVGITGASGLVGTALRDELRRRTAVNGKPVRIINLTRGAVVGIGSKKDWESDGFLETSVTWNPNATELERVIDIDALSSMDAVIHLAGENVATGLGPLGSLGIRPWTDEKKAEILNSRVGPTAALSKAMASINRPQTLLVASGVGAYGDNFVDETKEAVDETMDIRKTPGFLAQVSRQWEAAASFGEKSGQNRVVKMRFGVVMSTRGGALAKLYPIFLLGGGGIVGSGSQYFSFISARDIARGIVHCLETPSLSGPVNLSAPVPCTNLEFTKALGKLLNRPTLLPLPSFAVSLAFGEMGEEMLLGGVRCSPRKLLDSGFEFLHPTIDQALQSAINENI
jgi:hypothetical protein